MLTNMKKEKFQHQLLELQEDIINLTRKLASTSPETPTASGLKSKELRPNSIPLKKNDAPTGKIIEKRVDNKLHEEISKLKQENSILKVQCDDAISAITQYKKENEELRLEIMEFGPFKASFEHLKQDYMSLQISLESSERIRRQQKELIHLLQLSAGGSGSTVPRPQAEHVHTHNRPQSEHVHSHERPSTAGSPAAPPSTAASPSAALSDHTFLSLHNDDHEHDVEYERRQAWNDYDRPTTSSKVLFTTSSTNQLEGPSLTQPASVSPAEWNKRPRKPVHIHAHAHESVTPKPQKPFVVAAKSVTVGRTSSSSSSGRPPRQTSTSTNRVIHNGNAAPSAMTSKTSPRPPTARTSSTADATATAAGKKRPQSAPLSGRSTARSFR